MAEENTALKRLPREWRALQKKPVEGVEFELAKTASGEDNFLEWKVKVTGPDKYLVNDEMRDCPYAGVQFLVTFTFPSEYPFKAPEMKFAVGALHHPNVSAETGEICTDLVKEVFGPTKGVRDLALLITGFLGTPNFEHALDEDIAADMMTNIAKYESDARKMATGGGKK